MSDTYNGYSNYATWKVNLEFFSELCIEDLAEDFNNYPNVLDFSERLKQLFFMYCHDEDDHKDIVKSAINYFISDINFEELASLYMDEIKQLEDA